MTVTFDWLEDDDGDNQESGGLDAYIDVDGSGISFSGDQISSTNFDGGIPKAQPTNTQVRYVVPGNYVFWNISTNTPMTVSIGADVDGEDDGSDSTYESNLYLVLDVEYDDATDPDGSSTTATRYLYLQDEDESVKVSATGGTAVTIIGNSDPSEWDAGTNGWLLTSDGNAIFRNVLVRGTIDASTIQGSLFKTIDSNDTVATQIPTSGTIIFRGIKADGTKSDSYITIDTEDGDIGSAADNAGLNIFSAGGKRVTIDANELQATTNDSASSFVMNSFGGNIIIGSSSNSTTLKIWGSGTTPLNTGTLQSIEASGDIATTGDMYANQFRTTGTGSAGEVLFGFQDDTGFDSGLYYIGQNSFGISAGGNNILTFTSTEFQINQPTVSSTTIEARRFTASGATSNTANIIYGGSNSSSYTGNMFFLYSITSSGYDYLEFQKVSASAPFYDVDYRITGGGATEADGAYSTPASDYAEYFEWEDGNPNSEDRVGMSVSLINNKIKKCIPGETPIGIVSANPTIIGDSAWSYWKEKYLTDEFGRYLYEEYNVITWVDENNNDVSYEENNIPPEINIPEIYTIVIKKRRILNPEFDPNLEYIPRSERKEWSEIGLLGKLRLRKGQPVAPTWIKLRDISENIEEWLVK